MFEDLRGFIEHLREQGEVMVVSDEISVDYEIAAAIRLIAEREGAVAVFNKVKGYDAVVVGNLLGAKKRLSMAMFMPKPQGSAPTHTSLALQSPDPASMV